MLLFVELILPLMLPLFRLPLMFELVKPFDWFKLLPMTELEFGLTLVVIGTLLLFGFGLVLLMFGFDPGFGEEDGEASILGVIEEYVVSESDRCCRC